MTVTSIDGKPTNEKIECPLCGSYNVTYHKSSDKYHCNECKADFIHKERLK